MGNVTYDRPQKATLHVHLENGETFEATPEDIEKFGFINRLETYMRIDSVLVEVAEQINGTHEVTDISHLNTVRYLCEVLISYPHIFEQCRADGETYEELFKGLREIAAIELAPDTAEYLADMVREKMIEHAAAKSTETVAT